MLAARATARRATKLSRSFATAVDSAGVKVAAVDHGQPTSAVTFLVKAGSRYEPKPGVANVLKNFAFKGTSSRSALGTVRETELYGGVLSSTLSREHLALTAEFLRGDEAYFVDVLSSIISSTKFTPWELKESVLPAVTEDTRVGSSNPATLALELAHAIAFHTGLGSSVFAPPHVSVSAEDVKSYAAQAFSKSNIAVLGTGIDQFTLAKLVEKHLGASSSASATTSIASQYFGGETRHVLHGGPQTVFIGFGATGAPSAELAVLATHLSTAPSVKWSASLSPITAVIPAGVTVQPVLLPYSDATLFGLLIQGASADAVKQAAAVSVKVLKDTSMGGSVTPEELKKAIAKAKFAAATAVEDREGFISTFGPKVLAGSEASFNGLYTALDGVSATNFFKAASSLVKTAPTFVTVGDGSALPYKDEVGL
ncbi:Metalloenzyme, LuxS/M16 peptidase-like protein [Phellopilus nigrolimitatus]|nr:Metalloenzyme, LuxS/M16 peptidase-like protein [Phellopilus nigrolimitatus]